MGLKGVERGDFSPYFSQAFLAAKAKLALLPKNALLAERQAVELALNTSNRSLSNALESYKRKEFKAAKQSLVEAKKQCPDLYFADTLLVLTNASEVATSTPQAKTETSKTRTKVRGVELTPPTSPPKPSSHSDGGDPQPVKQAEPKPVSPSVQPVVGPKPVVKPKPVVEKQPVVAPPRKAEPSQQISPENDRSWLIPVIVLATFVVLITLAVFAFLLL